MVRFSDMLGGSGEPDDARAANSPFAALKSEELDAEPQAAEVAEDEGEPGVETPDVETPDVETPDVESPEDVLNRLRRYASAARAADRDPPWEPADEPLPPVGDDLLPDSKGVDRRSGRSRKRRDP